MTRMRRNRPFRLPEMSRPVRAFAVIRYQQHRDALVRVLANGELPFPSITLSDGTKIDRLDQSTYEKYRQALGSRTRTAGVPGAWREASTTSMQPASAGWLPDSRPSPSSRPSSSRKQSARS